MRKQMTSSLCYKVSTSNNEYCFISETKALRAVGKLRTLAIKNKKEFEIIVQAYHQGYRHVYLAE